MKLMKRIIVFVSLVLICISNLFAGEFSSTGIKLGLNYSKFIGQDTPEKGVSNIAGLAVGGFLTYRIDKRFSIRQELFLTTKGSKINTVGDINLYNIFVYVELPLLAKVTFRSESMIKPIVFCGPAFNIKIMAINDVGILEDINSIDWGLILGTGIELKNISLEFRYNRGLSNFDESADNIDLKNQTFSFLIGYSF